jgi:hypothetical protein
MPIIKADSSIITQINVFTVPSGQQQELIEYLADAARVAREVDGWLSASLHRSIDGTRVVNYAQSSNLDAARRVFEHLNARGLIKGNKRYGDAHPGLYEVAFTLER